jgi:hypothetical protein
MKKWTRGIPVVAYGLLAIILFALVAFSIMEANRRDRAVQILVATAQALERLTPAGGTERLGMETLTATSTPAPSPSLALTPTSAPSATPAPAPLPTSTPGLTNTPTTVSTVRQKPEPTRTPTSTSTSTSTATSAPTPSPSITRTLTTTPSATSSPASTPTTTRTLTPIPPTARATTVSVTPSPTPVPTGQFILLSPTWEEPTYGPTEFRWKWIGELRPGQGFEVRVWREGETPTGAHDSRQDNLDGKIIPLGDDTYRFSVDISDVAGVRGVNGDYLWTVVLVQVSPEYRDLGIQAVPELLQFVGGEGEAKEGPSGPPTSR